MTTKPEQQPDATDLCANGYHWFEDHQCTACGAFEATVDTHKLGVCLRFANGETCVGCGDPFNGMTYADGYKQGREDEALDAKNYLGELASEVQQEVELPPLERMTVFQCAKCESQFEDDRTVGDNGVLCPECRSKGLTVVGVCSRVEVEPLEEDYLAQRERQLLHALQQNAALKEQLAAMTEDRNLWRDDHNGDCPNESQVKALTEQIAVSESARKAYVEAAESSLKALTEQHRSYRDDVKRFLADWAIERIELTEEWSARIVAAETRELALMEEVEKLKRDLDYYGGAVLELPHGVVIDRKAVRSAIIQDVQVSNACCGALLKQLEDVESQLSAIQKELGPRRELADAMEEITIALGDKHDAVSYGTYADDEWLGISRKSLVTIVEAIQKMSEAK